MTDYEMTDYEEGYQEGFESGKEEGIDSILNNSHLDINLEDSLKLFKVLVRSSRKHLFSPSYREDLKDILRDILQDL